MSQQPPSGAGLCDAHMHLQDPDLQAALKAAPHAAAMQGVAAQVVNGTQPADWDAVRALQPSGPVRLLRAYGVHPWRVDNLPADWEPQLRGYLASGAASVGEIGLDHWIEPRDERLQVEIFERQLAIAAEFRLAPTIHCLRAWGLLLDVLRAAPALPRGFLVHAFAGSRETLFALLDLGGFVSFSAYAADPRRQRMREAIRACPAERLLAETDAPDMVPPPQACRYPLAGPSGERLHHPAEIHTAYALLAQLRGEHPVALRQQLAGNFRVFKGWDGADAT